MKTNDEMLCFEHGWHREEERDNRTLQEKNTEGHTMLPLNYFFPFPHLANKKDYDKKQSD